MTVSYLQNHIVGYSYKNKNKDDNRNNLTTNNFLTEAFISPELHVITPGAS